MNSNSVLQPNKNAFGIGQARLVFSLKSFCLALLLPRKNLEIFVLLPKQITTKNPNKENFENRQQQRLKMKLLMFDSDVCLGVLKWSSIGSGVIATLGGLKTYFSLGSSVSIPMQFGIFGQPTWFMSSPHAFLVYPLISATLTGAGIWMSRSNPDSRAINYPFEFSEEKRKIQHQLAVNYTHSLSLVTNIFMFVLSTRFIPDILAGRRGALPSYIVGELLVSIGAVSIAYFYTARAQARSVGEIKEE